MAQQAVQDGERHLEKGNPAVLGAMGSLAMVESIQGNSEAALALFRKVYEGRRLKLGPEARSTLSAQLNLGIALSRAHDHLPEADATLHDLLAVLDRTGSPENPSRVRALASLAQVLRQEGKNDEAIAMFRSAADVARRVMGPEHPDTLSVMNNFSDALRLMRAAQGSRGHRPTNVGRSRAGARAGPPFYDDDSNGSRRSPGGSGSARRGGTNPHACPRDSTDEGRPPFRGRVHVAHAASGRRSKIGPPRGGLRPAGSGSRRRPEA